MAASTYELLCDSVRNALGDTDVPGGDVFTNDEIRESFITAWDEMQGMMAADQIPAVKRIRYHKVPSYTLVLYPSQARITDLDTTILLEERAMGNSVNISGALQATFRQEFNAQTSVVVTHNLGTVNVTPIAYDGNGTVIPWSGTAGYVVTDLNTVTVTFTGSTTGAIVVNIGNGQQILVTTDGVHSLTGTPLIYISDVLGIDFINARWYADVISTTRLLLRGSIFSGVYESGGTISTSAEQFKEVYRRETLSQRDPDSRLGEYSWREDAFQFVGATADIEVRIAYFSDGSAPTTGSLVYDGIKNPLAVRTAAILAYKHSRGQNDGARLDREARGRDLDGHEGLYYLFLSQKVRELQEDALYRPVRSPDYWTEIYEPIS